MWECRTIILNNPTKRSDYSKGRDFSRAGHYSREYGTFYLVSRQNIKRTLKLWFQIFFNECFSRSGCTSFFQAVDVKLNITCIT